MAKRTTKASTNWLDEAVEVPREAVVANGDRVKRQKRYRRFIVAAVVLLPVALGMNVFAVANGLRPNSAAEASAEVSTEGKAAAILGIREWLSSAQSPLPLGGSMVSWDGGEVMAKPAQSDSEAQRNPLPDYDIEIHRFTLADGLLNTYSSDVQVAVDPVTGAHIIGTPSLVPNAPSTDGSTVADAKPWFGLTTTATPDAVVKSIGAWSDAFTSGDPDALRQVVQDSNGRHTYVPLSNVVDHEVTVVTAAFVPDDDQDSTQAVTSSATMLVQVQFTIRWIGAEVPENGKSTTKITYDLLVKNADGAAPIVVAWGGPGSGSTLTAYSNALIDREIVFGQTPVIPTPTPAPTLPLPTPTPTPSGQTAEEKQIEEGSGD